ncbi:MAG TPA: hypothetical protein VGG44_05135 [Tepidisphaeraceae bacterium]|jgi:hypothetical protein
MTCRRITLGFFCSLALIVGCAKTDDSAAAGNGAATQPAAGVNESQQAAAVESPATAPAASVLTIGQSQQSFPAACLRLTSKNGKVTARLYSDDPRDVLTGKTTVNSFDLVMTLPGISDPADIAKATWVNPSASMDRQDSPYGIFLNHQQDVLQPMEVTVKFQGVAPRVKVLLQGSFALFHIADKTPQAVPAVVNVFGVLDTTVSAGK